MNVDVNKILNDYGAKLVARLQNDIRNKQVTKFGAVNASGNLANSIQYTVQDYKLTITGADYIYYLQFGRKPGKRPPTSVIRQWIDEKGINPTDISKDSLAFLIARKIGEEGTEIHKQGGSDLVSSIFNEALQREIETSFENLIATEIQSEILNIAA